MTQPTNESNQWTDIPSGRRLSYRLRRHRYADSAVYPGERTPIGHDPELQQLLSQHEEQIEKLRSDNTSLRDLALRARAELDNARKRLEREKAETVKYANERLVRQLLEVLDNLERALGSVEDDEATRPMREGIRMVLQQFMGILTANGLEVVHPEGETFDPHFHEAVAAEERDDVPDQQVIDTLQKGYVLRGRVVRPAMVRVARAPQPAAEPAAIDPDKEDTLADEEEIEIVAGEVVEVSEETEGEPEAPAPEGPALEERAPETEETSSEASDEPKP
jgi:molecular chaperone GrpE